MNTVKLFPWVFLGVVVGAASAWAQGTVEIAVTLSPAGSFVATSSQVAGTAQKKGAQGYSARNVVLELSSLKTGIDLRDRHMKDKYFEVKKYPRAILRSGSALNGKFQGDLEVHGKVKKISGHYALDKGVLLGKFKCALSDFGIAEARYMGVGVEDEVEVQVGLPIGAVPGAKR